MGLGIEAFAHGWQIELIRTKGCFLYILLDSKFIYIIKRPYPGIFKNLAENAF
jgi:hypothetical protein